MGALGNSCGEPQWGFNGRIEGRSDILCHRTPRVGLWVGLWVHLRDWPR